jgi:AcrR family transcriptional regulator
VALVDEGVLVPPYRRIAEDIRTRIVTGELRPGDRIPSARRLTREWGVAIATATKALALLRDEGLTTARQGVGTVVAERVTPRPERDLTLARIVAAATAIADAQGMAEMSMRRIAAELGVATMSLYRHVPGKDELVLAMIDAAYGELVIPAGHDGDWRAAVTLGAREQWQMFRRHPWLAPSMSLTRPQLSPNALRATEWVMSALTPTGLAVHDRLLVHVMLFSFVRGVATGLEPEAEAVRETGVSNEQWFDAQNERFASLIDSHRMASIQQVVSGGQEVDLDLDRIFEFGLGRLLDGIAVLAQV